MRTWWYKCSIYWYNLILVPKKTLVCIANMFVHSIYSFANTVYIFHTDSHIHCHTTIYTHALAQIPMNKMMNSYRFTVQICAYRKPKWPKSAADSRRRYKALKENLLRIAARINNIHNQKYMQTHELIVQKNREKIDNADFTIRYSTFWPIYIFIQYFRVWKHEHTHTLSDTLNVTITTINTNIYVRLLLMTMGIGIRMNGGCLASTIARVCVCVPAVVMPRILATHNMKLCGAHNARIFGAST